MDTIKDIIIFLAIAAACGLLAAWLKGRKKAILIKVGLLIQWAELKVKGSGMGEDKKALVIAKLQEDGIKVTKWLDKAIDETVSFLNRTSGWLKESADVEGTVKDLADKIKEE